MCLLTCDRSNSKNQSILNESDFSVLHKIHDFMRVLWPFNFSLCVSHPQLHRCLSIHPHSLAPVNFYTIDSVLLNGKEQAYYTSNMHTNKSKGSTFAGLLLFFQLVFIKSSNINTMRQQTYTHTIMLTTHEQRKCIYLPHSLCSPFTMYTIHITMWIHCRCFSHLKLASFRHISVITKLKRFSYLCLLPSPFHIHPTHTHTYACVLF